MLSFFFNRRSKIVLLMEVIGVPIFAVASARALLDEATAARIAFISIITIEYLFIRLCATIQWYKEAPRCSGIELHFKKALVPTGYILTFLGTPLIMFPSTWVLGIMVFLFAVIAHVNIILLYFHLRDHDPTTPNYYSSGRYLQT